MDINIQNVVNKIIGLSHRVRRGSTASACLLFPLLAADCTVIDEIQNGYIVAMLENVGVSGRLWYGPGKLASWFII
jgi:hypothetical protein